MRDLFHNLFSKIFHQFLNTKINKMLKIFIKSFVSHLKRFATCASLVSSVQQNAFDGRHLEEEK